RHRVRVADAQLDIGALERSAVADALDLEALLEALRDTLDHVSDQRPGQAVQCAILAALGRTGDGEDALVLGDLHPLRHLLLERAEWAHDGDAPRLQRHSHAARDFDWSLADTTHCLSLRERLEVFRRWVSLLIYVSLSLDVLDH